MTRNAIVVILIVFVTQPILVHADALVVTKAMTASTVAEVFVEDDLIRIELEIGGNDIEAFKNILPEELYAKFNFESPLTPEQRIERFFSDDMKIQGDGNQLTGSVVDLTVRKRIKRDEITGKPLVLQPDDAEVVIYAQLEYDLEGRPKTISLTPPTESEHDRVTANIGFMTYHRGLPVMDFRYLSGEETLDLDWHDPWYSEFRNKNLRRQYNAPLSVFLYIEPFEVRVEVVVRPVDIQRWKDVNVSAEEIIPVDQQEQLKTAVAEFLNRKFDVTIDGQPAKGQFDRSNFIRRSLRKTGVIYPPEDLHASAATLGVIFVYPIEKLPNEVAVTWDLFDEKIKQIPVSATDEAGGLPSTISIDSPVLEWKNFLTNPTVPAMLAIEPPPIRPKLDLPVVSIGLLLFAAVAGLKMLVVKPENRTGFLTAIVIGLVLGSMFCWPLARKEINNPFVAQTRVTVSEAQNVTNSLIHNLYRSFDRKQESIIYDQLATCVSGDLLRETYIQMMQRIVLEDQGGAQIKIDNVDVLDNQVAFPEEGAGFHSTVKWNVVGSVGHWGHLHQRASQYEAEYAVQPVDGVWKIVSIQVTDQMNLDVSTN